ncbi:hypothetical protein [Paludisphaera mucosa]|uniref:Uncharacterized protein n=1 Tax=Paludisphaera mucosa TaxID=3030827 RepID=A0ABT6F8P1_9BACT|nr:hypothetical protein [Paludisphaera mucosa]MDG3003799.1 hypothetical protein [Paludisphaera mucosa]
MPAPPQRRSWSRSGSRLVATLVALALVAAFGPTASASATDAHSAVCKCGPRCRGAACCCGSKADRPRAPGRAPEKRPARATIDPASNGPCLGSTPCGDPAAPAPAVTGASGEAALSTFLVARGVRLGGLVAPPTSDRHASRGSVRLDRPPKADASA